VSEKISEGESERARERAKEGGRERMDISAAFGERAISAIALLYLYRSLDVKQG